MVELGVELVLGLELEVVAAQLGRSRLAQYLRHQAAGSLLHRRRLFGMAVVVMAQAVLAGLHWRLAPRWLKAAFPERWRPVQLSGLFVHFESCQQRSLRLGVPSSPVASLLGYSVTSFAHPLSTESLSAASA